MKTIAKINPEQEYENAKKIIELARQQQLDASNASSLDSSVDNLITAARVLIEREERRRGKGQAPVINPRPKGRRDGDERQDSRKLPSERFPSLEIKESIIRPQHNPKCSCCDNDMKESGLFDVSEKLEVIPKQYYIERNKRPKYTCSHCHGSMVNTPALPSIVPTSNYGDSLIIDVALSKFCDLLPMERYVQIACRHGLEGLPAQSLIGQTHHLANFLFVVYEKIKQEILSAVIVQADETPHNMLEGDDTKSWYLWGFFSAFGCYFEAHNTRSGDVAFNFLKMSQAKYLVSDGYGGYSKARRLMKEKYQRDIVDVYCNAHAYRYFEEASITWKDESAQFLHFYGEIFKLERQLKEQNDLTADDRLAIRQAMVPFFEQAQECCQKLKTDAMPESLLKKAVVYFLNHYDGLTVCTRNIDIPLENNLCERELRSPVIGRKTWYGTHSKRGALTTAVIFSIVQSCKMNNVNPRNYFPWVVYRIHEGKSVLTPREYLLLSG